MEITKELIAKAKEMKTVEELIAFAKDNGVELSTENAAKTFAALHKSGELADSELDNVSGGSCLSIYGDSCPKCGCTKVRRQITEWNGMNVQAWCCADCGEFIDLAH